MASLGSLVIELAANTARLQSDLGKAVNIAQSASTRITTAFRTVAGVLGAGGLSLTASAVFTKFIQNSAEAQASTLKLEGAVRRAGAASAVTMVQIEGLANSIQASSRFGDEAVKDAATNLLRFDKITGETFTRALRISADLAEVMGTDVPEAALSLGKALQLPGEGLRVLVQAGIKFNDEQIKTLQYMTETGRAAEAQNIILDELAKRTSGAAAEGVKTLGGAFAQLGNEIGELAEAPEAISRITKSVNFLSESLERLRNSNTGQNLRGLAEIAKIVLSPGSVIRGVLTDKMTEDPAAKYRGHRGSSDSQDILADENAKRLAAEKAAKDAARNPSSELSSVAVSGRKLTAEWIADMEQSTRTNAENQRRAYEESTSSIQILLEKRVITQEEALDRMQEAEETYNESIRKTSKKTTTDLSEMALRSSQAIGSSMEEFFFDPFGKGLKNAARSFTDFVRHIAAEKAANKFLDYLTPALSSGKGFLGGVGSLLGYADGGTFNGRSPFIVGERGPEIIVPTGSGTVIPNHEIGGSGAVVTINNNIDARGATMDLTRALPAILQKNNELMRREIIGRMSALIRGGAYDR